MKVMWLKLWSSIGKTTATWGFSWVSRESQICGLISIVCLVDFNFPVAPENETEHISFASASATMGLNGVDRICGLYSSEAF